MKITNEQKSATMVTISLRVSVCRNIITNSNITKVTLLTLVILVIHNTDVNNPLNAIDVYIQVILGNLKCNNRDCIKMNRDKIRIQTCYIHLIGTLMYIACLFPNLVSVHLYAIPIITLQIS